MLWMGIWCTLTLLRLCRAGSGVDFRKIELSPSPSDVVMSWLKLQTRTDCFPHPCHMQHLDMLWMGIWVYPYTVMPVQVGRGVLENWGGAWAEPE